MISSIKKFLALPLMLGQHLDSARTTEMHRRIILSKPFLRRIYEEWYALIVLSIPEGSHPILEIGSGGGFLKTRLPGLITSEILPISGVDLRANACNGLPFKDQSLRAIVMVDVFHHLPTVRHFLSEAYRCLVTGGVIIMIEPWITPWSEFIFRRFHHEPCKPDMHNWHFSSSGPLSGANAALPWIVFHRDSISFQNEYPNFVLKKAIPFMPFRYLISGGVSMRSLFPEVGFIGFRMFERLFSFARNQFAMFAHIVVSKVR